MQTLRSFDELESYALFRFIKVIYNFFLVIFLLAVTLFGVGIFSENFIAAVLLWIIGAIIVYTILNVFRESVIYIFYGRNFTWDWVIMPIRYLKELHAKHPDKSQKIINIITQVFVYLILAYLLLTIGDVLHSHGINSLSDIYKYFINK